MAPVDTPKNIVTKNPYKIINLTLKKGRETNIKCIILMGLFYFIEVIYIWQMLFKSQH